MTGFIPKEKLSAYQRWEVAAFDEAEQAARKASETAKSAPAPTHEAEPEPESPPVVLPTAADIERIVAAVEQMAYNSLQEEITTKQIGEMVMSSLRQLDEVAYVRFASVYRQFTDIPTFMRELSHMLDEAGRSGEKNAPADTAGTAEEAAKQEE